MTLAIAGGHPVRSRPFPKWPPVDEAQRAALLRVLESGRWSRLDGHETEAFEAELAAAHGAPAALAVTNCTQSIELALELLDVGPGQEVIVPALTFIATSNAVQRHGAVPVPVDIDPETFCLDPAALDLAGSDRSKVVMPVHFAGHLADLDGIGQWAAANGATVVQDAALAHGTQWRGRRLGELGSMACLSFQGIKPMAAGEGGALLLPENRYDDAYVRHSCGRPRESQFYRHVTSSSNLRMNEFSAALLRAQLPGLAEQNERRERQWRRLRELLAEIPGITLQGRDPRCTVMSHGMVMLVLDQDRHPGLSRDAFVEALVAEGIPAFTCYPAIYRTEAFWSKATSGLPSADGLAQRCPNTERISRQGLWLRHQVLLGGERELTDVVEAVHKVVTQLAGRDPS